MFTEKNLGGTISYSSSGSNVLGSTNILEAMKTNSIKHLIYITSDKCYLNDSRKGGYLENDILGGKDLYSASKACAELTFKAYYQSFFLYRQRANRYIG